MVSKMAEVENESVEQTLEDSAGSSEIDRLTALLESELEQPEGEEESDQEADEAETVDAEFEEIPEEEAAEDEEVDEDPTDDSEEEQSEEMTFEVDGESLTAEELKLGYLRQSDYTKKTQAVAEQRKAYEAQTEQTQATMNALLSAANADLSRFQGVNWEAVAVENPDQYKQAKAAFEQTQSTYNYIQAQAEQFQEQQQQQSEQAHKEAAAESLTVLKTNIPNWNNDLYYKIGDYAQKELGVGAEEFNQVADHRIITALHKAMLFDQAKQVTAKKKIKPSPTKTLSGGKADSSKAVQSESARKTRERLRKTGTVDDAAAALLNRMK
jgi:hypothetical protein